MSETENNSMQGSPDDLNSALSGGETEFIVSDEKKPVVTQQMLYFLLVLAIGGGGTYFMYKKQGPQQATAASAETTKAQETIDTFLTSGPGGIKMMEEMLRNTEKVVKQFLDYPSVTQVPLSALHTNPFRLGPASSETPSEEMSKKKKEEQLAAALKASQALNLQSIMKSGSRSACMINNAMYTEGQIVEGFTVEKIQPGSIIVKKDAFRFELKMKK